MNKKFISLSISLVLATSIMCACNTSNSETSESSTNDYGIEVGDIITFGHYEQDHDYTNGMEDIEWIVLDTNENGMLLLSRYAIDYGIYNDTYFDTTWETSPIRSWMNFQFCNRAFSSEEQERILTTTVSNPDNPDSGSEGGNDTQDRVFFLSVEEMETYFGHGDDLEHAFYTTNSYAMAEATNEARYDGVFAYEDFSNHNENNRSILSNCYWWLRTPGDDNRRVATVGPDGIVNEFGDGVDYYRNGIRPALWLSYEE